MSADKDEALRHRVFRLRLIVGNGALSAWTPCFKISDLSAEFRD